MNILVRPVFLALAYGLGASGVAAAPGTIEQAIIGEADQKTPEASTEDVRNALKDKSAIILDARKRAEFVAGHIAGAKGLSLKPDASSLEIAAAVEDLLG